MRSVLVGAALLLATSAARAETAPCGAFGPSDDPATAELGRIVGKGPAGLLADGAQIDGCPANGRSCRTRDSVAPDDLVVVAKRDGAFACVIAARRHAITYGWLPQERFETVHAPVAPQWEGEWRRGRSARIWGESVARDRVRLRGEAHYGEGAYATEGDIDQEIDARAAAVDWVEGDGKKAFKDAAYYECAVRMKQLGPYLVVQDNEKCGGLNVTFTGLYIRW